MICCVPFCEATTTNKQGYGEWLCREHWYCVKPGVRRLHKLRQKHLRTLVGEERDEYARRHAEPVWAYAKKQAIETAAGIR